MIVGTAGHIDHGKTTLVHALTGVDTDRLPEEKKRGISIELGYAFMELSSGTRIGFVDVPGHERLVHTMLAGATGIDYALLLVAADDGVMSQTREHLAALSLLGIDRGAVVMTKIDRADAQRIQTVHTEVAALLDATPLAGSPVLKVCAPTGHGLEALKKLLVDVASASTYRAIAGAAFRLAIDRVFTLEGIGTVVTGTVHAGFVSIGDALVLVPGEQHARVRSLHAQNRRVTQAHAGERCAVALAGVGCDQVRRGQWLVAPAVALATQRMDATLTLWHAEPRALRSGTAVHIHLGAAAMPGSVAILEGDTLAPGSTARVQLVLQAPVGAWQGDRIVLRDASASRTIAGGCVLDPFAPVRYRRTPQRLAELDALALRDTSALLAAAPHGVDLRLRAAAAGLEIVASLSPGTLRQTDTRADWALGTAQTIKATASVLTALASFHDHYPDEPGPDAARLRRLTMPRLPDSLWRALLVQLRRDGAISGQGAFVQLPAHGVKLSATDERISQKVKPMLLRSGFDGAWVRELARGAGESEPLMRTTLSRLAHRGELHQVVKDLYYLHATIAKLAVIVRLVGDRQGEHEITAAAFRDATQLGRKRAILILEYLDRVGFLRRVGDGHRLRTDSALFAGAE